MLTFGTVCSGIGAPEAAWKPLGWRCAFMSEIDAFPRAVLSHHYPEVPLHGDFTTIQAGQYAPIDLLCGGTPCQSFSVAGLRGGLADERGNLALEFLRLAGRLRPRWVVWENVPGVLSSAGGRDFGAFLGGVGELGYGFAYRVLDAQFFGLAQQRQRVFVVGYLGDWRPAAAVLFEPTSLRGDPAPRREAGERVAPTVARGSPGGSGYRNDADTADNLIPAISPALKARDFKGPSSDGDGDGAPLIVAHTLRAEGHDASEDGTGRGVPLVPMAFPWQQGGTQGIAVDENICGTLVKNQTPAVAFDLAQITSATNRTRAEASLPCSALAKGSAMHVGSMAAVRRLTPAECEALQGFPRGYTAIPYRNGMAADGPRYRALGNSMAVPVVSWIGRRIANVDAQMRAATEEVA